MIQQLKNFIRSNKINLLILIFSLALGVSPNLFAQLKNATTRPNIIFLLTDDQRFDALGAMGNKIIHTPNLDRLANEGILFKNAYVTTSICCVSRASLLTGQYESRHHIDDFNTSLSNEAMAQTYPALLKKTGYALGFIGKFGVGTKPPDSLFDYMVNTEEGGKTQPDYIIIRKDGSTIHDTDSIGNAIDSFLAQYAKISPFCLSVSFKAPHEQDGNPPKYIIQHRYKDLYKDIKVPTPLTADPKYWNQFPDFFRTDSNFARQRWKGLFGTQQLFQENVKNYYRLITGVDDVVGKLLQKLQQSGIAENTIIIFMGDNGMFLGEHGLEGKWYGYEESIRVPLIIYDPVNSTGNIRHVASQIALNIDVAPTILSIAGVPVPASMQGLNLLDLAAGKTQERKQFFYQHYFLGSPYIPKVEGVVSKRFKYMLYIEHNYEELFDLKNDPHETLNLADDPAYKATLESMRYQFTELKKAAL